MKHQQDFRLCLAAAVAVATLAMQGCAVSGSPDWDGRLGEATRRLQSEQRLDPTAVQRNADAKVKSDGRIAREARDRYVESYAAPPQSAAAPAGK
jgi:hypothetical protein